MSFRVPNKYRVRKGKLASDDYAGNNGCFLIPNPFCRLKFPPNDPKAYFCVIASDGMGWDHVSVSIQDRCPTWEEMNHVKGIFWSDSDCVVQYHPPKKNYVNTHPHCLHLWRPQWERLPEPPIIMV
jgi:hypothetical protein